LAFERIIHLFFWSSVSIRISFSRISGLFKASLFQMVENCSLHWSNSNFNHSILHVLPCYYSGGLNKKNIGRAAFTSQA
jgi:hypothetical protein